MDVVVPFRGPAAELERVRERLAGLVLADGDSVVVVDNRPGGRHLDGAIPVHASVGQNTSGYATPGFARNRGAERGSAEWIAFMDHDVLPPPDLLDRYFDPLPDDHTGLLAGGVTDEPVGRDAPAAARYAHLRGLLSQDNTLAWGEWAFAQTANAAVRRTAFEAGGGFREDVRAGEDPDLTYRLRDAGWRLERRDHARVVHLSRDTVGDLVRQRMTHGAGGAWLDRQYPGSVPKKRWPGFIWWMTRYAVAGLARAARHRDPDRALVAVLEPLDNLAFELGRSRDNRRTPPVAPGDRCTAP